LLVEVESRRSIVRRNRRASRGTCGLHGAVTGTGWRKKTRQSRRIRWLPSVAKANRDTAPIDVSHGVRGNRSAVTMSNSWFAFYLFSMCGTIFMF
jgi:hypothetical protein